MIGKKIEVEATVGVVDTKLTTPRVLMDDIDGEFPKDHSWIRISPKMIDSMKKLYGKRVKFRATVYQYIGIGKNDEQIEKIGLQSIRKLEEKK
jgi:hypothetical protein